MCFYLPSKRLIRFFSYLVAIFRTWNRLVLVNKTVSLFLLKLIPRGSMESCLNMNPINFQDGIISLCLMFMVMVIIVCYSQTTGPAVVVYNFSQLFLFTSMDLHHGSVVYPSQVSPEVNLQFLPQLESCFLPSASRFPPGFQSYYNKQRLGSLGTTLTSKQSRDTAAGEIRGSSFFLLW